MKVIMKLPVLFATMFLIFTFSSCEKDQENDPVIQLDQLEKTTLIFMYEEEKMARDVYSYLNGIYGLNIFENISASEQKHMNSVLGVLTSYEITPDVPDAEGVFADSNIQDLYNSLTAKGNLSLIDALTVGATIEDLDINDLLNAIDETNKVDIITMYETLTCGSRNHMRAFTGQLENREVTYSPDYISQELYDSILSGSHESCNL